MEVKKNPNVDLEKWRMVLFEIGLVVSLIATYLVFQIKSGGNDENVLGDLGDIKIEEEIIPITRMKEVKPPPPPPPKVVEELNIVEDDEEIEEEFEMDDSEADEETVVEQDIQVEEEEEDEPINFYVVEKKPTFPGGEAALYKYLAENTKYPEPAKENGITGTVWVQFIIDKSGKVTNVKVVRSVDPYLDKEAMRVVKSMPKWSPASQRGKPVRVIFQVPIRFELF